MSLSLSDRGCVKTQNYGSSGITVSGFPSGGSDYSVVWIGAAINEKDLVLPISTLNKNKILFDFGPNLSDVGLHGVLCMGKSSSNNSAWAKVSSWFEQNRVGKSSSTLEISYNSSAYKIFVDKLMLGKADPTFHIQSFAISGILAEP